MPINITAGYSPIAREYSRGVKNFHFCTEPITGQTGAGTAAITAFDSDGTWFPFRNQDGQGDITAAVNAGPGGVEWLVTGNIFQGGSDQSTLEWAQKFTASVNVPVVAEYNDGSYKYFGEVAVNGGAGVTSGIAGGADNGIALTFGGSLAVNPPQVVTVATNLDAITT